MEHNNYSNEYIVDKYKKGLQRGLGNLLNRVTRPKTWNVGAAVESCHGKECQSKQPHGDFVRAHSKLAGGQAEAAAAEMDNLMGGAALRNIMEFVFEV